MCSLLCLSQSMPTPTWLYHVPEVVGKQMGRSFPPPRGLKQLWPPPPPVTPSPRMGVASSQGGTFSSQAGAHATLAVTASTAGVVGGGTTGGGVGPGGVLPHAPVLPPTWGLHIIPPHGLEVEEHGGGSVGGAGDGQGQRARPRGGRLTFVVARLTTLPRRRADRKVGGHECSDSHGGRLWNMRGGEA